MEVVLGISFVTLTYINIWFAERKLFWKSYLAIKALPMLKLINKNEFATIPLNKNEQTF